MLLKHAIGAKVMVAGASMMMFAISARDQEVSWLRNRRANVLNAWARGPLVNSWIGVRFATGLGGHMYYPVKD